MFSKYISFGLLVSLLDIAAAGPCDIYSSGGTPCVAAHSTTRALYSAYNGVLYQVHRNSDGTTLDIYTTEAGGVADSASQDSFCTGTSCHVTIIYDQSGHGNDLSVATGGTFAGPGPGGAMNLADATLAPVYLDGEKVYGLYIEGSVGYRNNQAKGTATGDDPEGIYAVLDGTHFNDVCCFDYGNVETDGVDHGAGTMETIYFGNGTDFGWGPGDGPWILADLENGRWASGTDGLNSQDPSVNSRFLTAIVKGNSGNQWSIRGGDATTNQLSTIYEGTRPSGYNPMQKQGGIVLGVGGDNSHGGVGTFYEGALTAGYPSDDTEASVQADIASAGYSLDPSDDNGSGECSND